MEVEIMLNTFLIGCCYYPEHWEKENLKSDLERIKDLGFNCIRMGEFSWSMYEREEGRYDFSILDIHAEATGEKLAIAHAYDGRINVIFGTHTHVQTADECVLPKGTGYITDLGMCGESGGILGMSPESVVPRMRSHIGFKFEPATGAPEAQGAIFDLDQSTGRVRSVRRVKF